MSARGFTTVAAIALASACTFSEGEPFATVTPTFAAAWAPSADRDVGGGFFKLTNEYQVRLSRFEVMFAPTELVEAATAAPAGAGGTFDPSRPPPGYSLCHNGHCHADDGRLVDYEDIITELAGGGSAGPRVALTLAPATGFTANLLAPVDHRLACEPAACTLDLVELARARTSASVIVVEGVVRDGLNPPRLAGEAPFRFVTTQAVTLAGPLGLIADNQHDPNVRLRIRWTLGPRIFDGTEFAALAVAGTPIDLGGDAATVTRVRERLVETPLAFDVERKD